MGRKGRYDENKGGGGGGMREETLVRVGKILEEFRASDSDVHKFEPGLSKQERAAIHQLCQKMGMKSKSSGKGATRQLSVYKEKNQGLNRHEEETRTCLRFSEQSANVLGDLFVNFPPGDVDLTEGSLKKSSKKGNKLNQDTAFCKPSFSKSEIEKQVELLESRIKESDQLQKIIQDKAKLPITSYKDIITSTLENNQVVLISGETGCGKTTQVPQYILDHMWNKGESCKIVCTQPRRISAISVAERISSERGENVGDTVGYKIRLESKGGNNSSIMFCTNGVVLRILIGRGANASKSKKKNTKQALDDSIAQITHIIVDEIHERDRFSDFMLTILRDLLPLYPHLRLILMSATIDADRFSKYFNGCPVIQVPGFTYPVKSFYLEDVLSILKSTEDNHLSTPNSQSDPPLSQNYKNALDESITLALSNDEFDPLLELISEEDPRVHNYQHSLTGINPLMVFAIKGNIGDLCMLLSLGADLSLKDKQGKTALNHAEQENQKEIIEIIKNHLQKSSNSSSQDDLLSKYLSTINPEHIDTVLIEKLLRKICTDSESGAILIFLPGWEDINQTKERLTSSHFFNNSTQFTILSLHSMIPSSEQKKVFKKPPNGARKIILSTNIAETAVTIDDVVFVIDTGRMKEKSYDPYSNVSTLQSSWISKASVRQREGRAGRCQAGICYHLFSRFRGDSLPDFQIPEIKRMPIEELCLQVKLLDPTCKITDFLQRTLDPPVPETVKNAITTLQDLGALTETETLTSLGAKLGSLPVHPSISKMLLFAILMNCLDPALTLACASDYRDPFVLPMHPEERKRANFSKAELAGLYGGSSDQLAVVGAFECWRKARERKMEGQFCARYYVAGNTMNMIFNMRKQLLGELVKNGLVPADVAGLSVNAQDPGILRAVLMSGAYPSVGRVLPKKPKDKRTMIETASGSKVRLHPHSANFNLSTNSTTPLIIYDEILRGDGGMYVKKSSLVGPTPLLLLCNEMVVVGKEEDGEESEGESEEEEIMGDAENEVSVVVDRWLRFDARALDVAQVYCLRERLSSAVLFKVNNPKAALPPELDASMRAIASVLSFDGLASPSDPNQPRKGTNYIQPSQYLKSLFYDNYRPPYQNNNNYNNNNFQKFPRPGYQRNAGFGPRQTPPAHGGPGVGSSSPSAHGGPAVGSSSGPRILSTKRHRENGPR
ncbi:hypothetical protein LUZ60_001533 [Juncus effusus]|nr:hypothetical protein LUZ60_001533 [Juncus effusus]